MILKLNRSESGFTLIELLTCCAIVSVLAGICIQFFSEYKQRAFDSQAESGLRNAVTAEEAIFADTEAYADCVDAACQIVLPGYILTTNVNLSIVTRAGAASYNGIASHPSGAKVFEFDSDIGLISSS